MRVDHALRLGRRARRVADHRRGVGVDVRSTGERLPGAEVVEGECPGERRPGGAALDHDDVAQGGAAVPEGQQVLDVVDVAEAVDGDEGRGLRLAQDELDLPGAVERHDRHGHGPEAERGADRHPGLEPVGDLVDDAVPGTHPEPVEAPGEAGGALVELADGALVGPGLRPDPEGQVGGARDLAVQEAGEGEVGPPTLGEVALPQFRRHRPQVPHRSSAPSMAARITVFSLGEKTVSGFRRPPVGTVCPIQHRRVDDGSTTRRSRGEGTP